MHDGGGGWNRAGIGNAAFWRGADTQAARPAAPHNLRSGSSAHSTSGGAHRTVYPLAEPGPLALIHLRAGSSAGSIVAAIVCTRTADELEALYAGGAEGVCEALDLCFFDQVM